MKAAVLTANRKLSIREIPKPELRNPTDVLLKIRSVGICGSDIHYFSGGKIGDQIVEYPFILGHECSAQVAEIGQDVARLTPGDRVAVDPAVSCFQCPQCKMGHFHTCLNLQFLGYPGQLPGCLSEFIVLPEINCYAINPEMSWQQAALAEPLSIGIHALRQAGTAAMKKIAILGAGPIGLSVLLICRNRGIESIFVTDKIENRLRAAKNHGASWVGSPLQKNILSEISQIEPNLLDAVFECCGDQDALDQAIDLLRPGGQLIIVGIPENDRISFDISKLRRKEISIENVRRQNNCTQQAVKLIGSGAVNMDFMVTHSFTLEQTNEAYELASGYKDGVIKAMVDLS
ncbi:MAG TPA: hypothetical protein ENN22_10115 [bacterium]|nr:hypothetical protein [bacterium]